MVSVYKSVPLRFFKPLIFSPIHITIVMPSVHYYNQTGPFWDFVASLEQQGASRGAEASNNENEHEHERSNPWLQDWVGFPWGPMAHHGRHQRGPPPHHHHHGHPSPSSPPAPPAEGEAGSSEPKDPTQPVSDSEGEGQAHHGRHSHDHHGAGARGGRCGDGRGHGGPRGFSGRGGRRGTHGGTFGPFGPIAGIFHEQLFGNDNKKENKAAKSGDFTPEVDVFDTTDSFVIHTSLPGAKKEDVAVNWDAEKSELSIAGVMYRPGDEELLKTLALDERKVGAFDRKVRLGSRANPAQVDVDGITARLEDGVLRVEVPKLDAGYVEIKKVDIE